MEERTQVPAFIPTFTSMYLLPLFLIFRALMLVKTSGEAASRTS
jgi:hypothetical protein